MFQTTTAVCTHPFVWPKDYSNARRGYMLHGIWVRCSQKILCTSWHISNMIFKSKVCKQGFLFKWKVCKHGSHSDHSFTHSTHEAKRLMQIITENYLESKQHAVCFLSQIEWKRQEADNLTGLCHGIRRANIHFHLFWWLDRKMTLQFAGRMLST